MLLYQGTRENFLQSLQAVSGIVEKRHTLPILSNVLIQKSSTELTFQATDIEIQLKTSAHTVGAEDVSLTVGARKLQDILKSLPESSEVAITFEEKRLQIRAGKSRFNLQTLPSDDFPTMQVVDADVARITVTQGQFKRLLSLVQYSMAQQDIRYYLNGLLLVFSDNQIKVIATDGHRLAFAKELVQHSLNKADLILPRKAVFELSRQLNDSDENLEISISKTQAVFKFGNVELVSKLIDGKFPDYERVIPQHLPKPLVLNRQILLQALLRVAILTTDKFRGVRLVLSNGTLKIVSTNSDQEDGEDEIEVEFQGQPIDVGFNVTYLLDVLNNIDDEDIECYLTDSSSSALLMLPGTDRFKYVVMPMRI